MTPRAVFKTPIDVLACADLHDAHKRQILECWCQDALELQAAHDEELPMLMRVLDAVRTLERQIDASPLAR